MVIAENCGSPGSDAMWHVSLLTFRKVPCAFILRVEYRRSGETFNVKDGGRKKKSPRNCSNILPKHKPSPLRRRFAFLQVRAFCERLCVKSSPVRWFLERQITAKYWVPYRPINVRFVRHVYEGRGGGGGVEFSLQLLGTLNIHRHDGGWWSCWRINWSP